MGLILDIVNNVVPRVQQRVETGEELKEVLLEELEKEIAHYSTDQSKSYEPDTKTTDCIISSGIDLGNKENERCCVITLTENQAYYLEKFLGITDIDDTEMICEKYSMVSHLYEIEEALDNLWEQLDKKKKEIKGDKE